jgi:hypothetical protein
MGTQVKKNKMARACVHIWGDERCIQDFGEEILRKETIWKT